VFGQTETPTPNPSANTQQWQKQVADLRAEILRLQENMEGLETTLKVQEYQVKQKQDRQPPARLRGEVLFAKDSDHFLTATLFDGVLARTTEGCCLPYHFVAEFTSTGCRELMPWCGG